MRVADAEGVVSGQVCMFYPVTIIVSRTLVPPTPAFDNSVIVDPILFEYRKMSAEDPREMSLSPDPDESGGHEIGLSYPASDPSSGASTPAYSPIDVQFLDPGSDADVDDRAIPVQDSISYTRSTGTAAFEWSSKRSSDASSELFYGSFAEPLPLPEAQVRSLNFSKPPGHDVIKAIILRRRRDNGPFRMEFDDDFSDFDPKATRFQTMDELSRMYYSFRPTRSPLRAIGSPLSYMYPIRVVLDVLQQMNYIGSAIFPPPIPANILSPLDYVGPSRVVQGEDGWAFFVPSEMTVWKTVLERGVDKRYRPLFREPTTGQLWDVATGRQSYGWAIYSARSMVTSNFAVNLFRQLPSPLPDFDEILVEYLGMYVMRHIDNVTMAPESFHTISEEDMNRIYCDLCPDLPRASKPWMQFPFVKFSYIKFDEHLIGCIDRAEARSNKLESLARLQRDIADGVVDNSLNRQDIAWDWVPDDNDLLSTPESY